MASAPTLPLVSVDEYLNTSYHPDVEYVDGVLVEKGMPTVPHNLLERILLFWFAQFERQMRFKVMHEIRTVIVERARYRLPDIVLVPKPLRSKICDVVPWVVIEIVSPDDTIKKTRARFIDYTNLGVKHVLQLDPEEYVAHRFDNGSMIETCFGTVSNCRPAQCHSTRKNCSGGSVRSSKTSEKLNVLFPIQPVFSFNLRVQDTGYYRKATTNRCSKSTALSCSKWRKDHQLALVPSGRYIASSRQTTSFWLALWTSSQLIRTPSPGVSGTCRWPVGSTLNIGQSPSSM